MSKLLKFKIMKDAYKLVCDIYEALDKKKVKNKEKLVKKFEETVPYLNEKNEDEKIVSDEINKGIGELMKKGILEREFS